MRRFSKYVAPVLIAVLLVLYYVGVAVLFAGFAELSLPARVLLILGPLALAGVTVGVLIQRIREIGSGEEDDLDQY